jgi:hypothetical protein
MLYRILKLETKIQKNGGRSDKTAEIFKKNLWVLILLL